MRRPASVDEATVRIESNAPVSRYSVEDAGLGNASAMGESVTHVAQGLHDAEASRASTIGLIFALISFVVLVWTPFLGHPDDGRALIFGVILGVHSASSLGLWFVARRPASYTPIIFRAYGAVSVITAFAALVFLGPFSPTALVITLGISFFGYGKDRVGAWAICLSAIGLALLLLLAIVSGLVEDIGIFRGAEAGRSAMLFMTLMVPLVLMVTLIQAGWSRSAVELAMSTSVSSALDIKLKNVQLEEAQAELDRVFADGGLAGLHTGSKVSRFRLGPLLGRGASGEVYDAIDVDRGERAAVKILYRADANVPALVARFRREGEITRALRSPHIARLLEFGKQDGDLLYLAMERLDGSDLAAILRRRGRLSVRSCRRLCREVCDGLSVAHAAGVIHRDVKPHNLFLHQDYNGAGSWRILDFGVSKWISGSETLTQVGGVVGTPRYMSPEQANSLQLDERTDIFSLGGVLYRCLTGSPPFKSGGFAAVAEAANRRPERPRHLAPDLDRQVEAVLAIAMAPRAIDRFANCQEMSEAFDDAFERRLSKELYARGRAIPWRKGP